MKPLASRDTPSQQRRSCGVGTGVDCPPALDCEPEPEDELELGLGKVSMPYTGGIGMAWALRLTQLLGISRDGEPMQDQVTLPLLP